MKFQTILILCCTLIVYCNCTCPEIISRSSWNARPSKSPLRALRVNPPQYVVVHHSDTPQCNSLEACKSRVKSIQHSHMTDPNRLWQDIGYNFLIGTDGSILEGRGWGKHGSHEVKYNGRSIGICLIGNFMDVEPPQAQINALKNLINCGVESGKIQSSPHVLGHRQAKQTSCPGNKLFNIIKTWPTFDQNPN